MIFDSLFKPRKKRQRELFFDRSTIGTNRLWFHDAVKDTVLLSRQAQSRKIDDYFLRNHGILNRPNYDMGDGEEYVTAKVVVNLIKTIIKTHSDFICGKQVSLTGHQDLVADFNRIYKNGNYAKIDYELAYDLMKYGDAFEVVYLDKTSNLPKSRLINNVDAFPIYDDEHNYIAFVETWNGYDNQQLFNVYYPNRVEKWEDDEQIGANTNISGLPIHYSLSTDKASYSNLFADSPINDLVPLLDQIEYLLSKSDDAITKNSLSPIYVSKGGIIGTEGNDDMTGTVVNVEVDGDFIPRNTELDSNSLKMMFEEYTSLFFSIAQVPSILYGQSNIANISETSLKLLFLGCEARANETAKSLKEGYAKRFEYMRKIQSMNGSTYTDEEFSTLGVNFNMHRPVDTKSAMEEMQMQYKMDAISRRSIMEHSEWTTDVSEEIRRIEEEKDTDSQSGDNVLSNDEAEGSSTQTTTEKIEVTENKEP